MGFGKSFSSLQNQNPANAMFNDCLSELMKSNATPFGNYVNCVTEVATGQGNPLQKIGQSLKGVPSGIDCKFSIGDDGSGETPPKEDPKPTDSEVEKNTAQENGFWKTVKKVAKVISDFFIGVKADPVTGTGSQLLSEEGAAAEGAIKHTWIIEHAKHESLNDPIKSRKSKGLGRM